MEKVANKVRYKIRTLCQPHDGVGLLASTKLGTFQISIVCNHRSYHRKPFFHAQSQVLKIKGVARLSEKGFAAAPHAGMI